LRRPGFSTNSLTSSLQSSLALSSSIILRMLVVIGMSTFLISASSASICRRSFSSYHCTVILQLLLFFSTVLACHPFQLQQRCRRSTAKEIFEWFY
jgi:hypothetical protein